MFKQRNRKVVKGNNKATLDARHKEIMQKFDDEENKLDEYREELEQVNKKIKRYLKKKKSNLNDEELDDLFDSQRRRDDLENKIQRIENGEDVKDYYLKNGDILDKYYQDIQNVAHGGMVPTNSSKKTNNPSKKMTNKKSIIDFFSAFEDDNDENINDNDSNNDYDNNINKTIEYEDENENEDDTGADSDDSAHMMDDLTEYETVNRAKLLEDYLVNIDPKFTVPCKLNKKVDFCYENDCNGTEMVLQYNEGLMECPTCGTIQQIIVDCDRPSYKDPPPEVAYFAYKRINHFNEWLAQFQGKESTDIPKEVFDKILLEIKKERINNMASLTHKKIKAYLKKLGFNNYYDHVPFIINKLSGLPPPVISKETEEIFRAMFKELQSVFMIVCPPERNNFLSYSYTLHKFAELRGLDHLKQCFPLLKSRTNLYKQDVMFKKCCELLGWQYIKSI